MSWRSDPSSRTPFNQRCSERDRIPQIDSKIHMSVPPPISKGGLLPYLREARDIHPLLRRLAEVAFPPKRPPRKTRHVPLSFIPYSIQDHLSRSLPKKAPTDDPPTAERCDSSTPHSHPSDPVPFCKKIHIYRNCCIKTQHLLQNATPQKRAAPSGSLENGKRDHP